MAPEPAPLRMNPAEWQAQMLARSLLKQDAARETLRQQQAEPAAGEEWDPDADERRRWALQEASLNAPAERMGPAVAAGAMILPTGPVLVNRKGGLISEMRPAAFTQQVVGPGEWDAFDRQWRAERRRGENERLARYYGVDACVQGGLFTEDEAAVLDPERSRHVTLPPGVEAL